MFPETVSPPSDWLPLHLLPRGNPAVIERVGVGATSADEEIALRLMEIGFLPGEEVRVLAHGSRRREPVAVRIGQATFALRAREAALVLVRALQTAPKGKS